VKPEQKAALDSMNRFVDQHGGDRADVRLDEERFAYFWTAPDGRVAAIGWDARRSR
jgi:hypothetical protein